MNNSIELVSWKEAEEALKAVRVPVFVEEQGFPLEVEIDQQDFTAYHLLQRDEQSRPIGTTRLTPEGRLGRLAVLSAFRSKGFGKKLVREAERLAIDLGLPKVQLHAQLPVIEFYQALGYKVTDANEFYEDGVAHRLMVKSIPQESYFPLDELSRMKIHADRLVLATQRDIRLMSSSLDQLLFDRDSFFSALSNTARRSRHSDIRLLIKDPKPLVDRGHRLVNLHRRISSLVHIRVCGYQPKDPRISYLMGDLDKLLYMPEEGSYKGFANYQAHMECRRFVDEFDHLWQHSKPHSDLRELGI